MSGIDQRTYEIVDKWLRSLGVLCAGTMAADEARTRCAAYASMVAGEFPVAAFTQKSLEAVARECRFFPSYGELVEYLGKFWRDHKPAFLALPSAGPQSSWTATDQSWFDTWQRHQSEGFANVPNCPRYPGITPDRPENHRRAHVASMVRRFSPSAWTRIAAGEA
jgi:hypothetical protein